jgi:hypothetical protein
MMGNTPQYRLLNQAYSYKKIRITQCDPSVGYLEGRDSANQQIQLTFAFFQSPYVQVPKVGEHWLVTKLDNNWVIHSRFEEDNETLPVGELIGGDVRLNAPSRLFINAEQEIICDFNKARNSFAELGTATFPGSALYGSATLDQLNAGTVVVSQKLITPFDDFIPSRNVVDGQHCYYLFATQDERDIGWSFKYHAATISEYKWLFIGGAPYINFVSEEVTTIGTAWFNGNTNTSGTSIFDYGGSPVLRVPYDGEYVLSGGAEAYCGNNNIGFQLGLSINGSLPTSTLSGFLAAANTRQSVNTTYRITLNKDDELTEVYRKDPAHLGSPSNATLHFLNRWMQIIPLRVEADPLEDPEPEEIVTYEGA